VKIAWRLPQGTAITLKWIGKLDIPIQPPGSDWKYFQGVVLVLARHHNGQFPQPLQALWSMAFFFGVLISGNIHQPNGIGIAAFLFLFFFLVTLLILLPLRRQK
jgi:hypothetical protein